jgi:hypothetical protein
MMDLRYIPGDVTFFLLKRVQASANVMDLRYIPDDVSFEMDEVHSKATCQYQ